MPQPPFLSPHPHLSTQVRQAATFAGAAGGSRAGRQWIRHYTQLWNERLDILEELLRIPKVAKEPRK